MEPFYVSKTSPQLLQLFTRTLQLCFVAKLKKYFCGQQNFAWLSISVRMRRQRQNLNFWVNLSFKVSRAKKLYNHWNKSAIWGMSHCDSPPAYPPLHLHRRRGHHERPVPGSAGSEEPRCLVSLRHIWGTTNCGFNVQRLCVNHPLWSVSSHFLSLRWDRKNNPEPWNKLEPTHQYKVWAFKHFMHKWPFSYFSLQLVGRI